MHLKDDDDDDGRRTPPPHADHVICLFVDPDGTSQREASRKTGATEGA